MSSQRRAAKRRRTSGPSSTALASSSTPSGIPAASVSSIMESPHTFFSVAARSVDAIPNANSSASQETQDLPNTDMPEACTTDAQLTYAQPTVVLPAIVASSGYAWPPDRVPVEIFSIILQFLRRQDIQAMRLVNREFDSKLAEIYFSVVVVPFRPDFEALYGSLSMKGDTNDEATPEDTDLSSNQSNDNLLSAGHRVFQQFGDKMRKFALALEVDEEALAYPPYKIAQEIVAAPWGLYRWPIMSYQRYTQVEGMEQLANETGYMMEAFKYLKQVNEIGISCDAGLGWLHGPDINPYCALTLPPVFRPAIYEDSGTSLAANAANEEDQSPGLFILKQMATNAGYPPDAWPRVILRLLEDEGREGVIEWIERTLPCGRLIRDRVPYLDVDTNTAEEDIIFQINNAIVCDSQVTLGSITDNTRIRGLNPCNLSTAQAEMVLELEWAHRALMQSYRLAVLDNKDSFRNLKVLNIARCPSSRITTWCDDAFWETMTSIETFHLGVIPDWREIDKNASGAIDQRRVSPSDACQNVFRLLDLYVAEQENIKNISFEWVCGGEFAMGKSQRDRYILPAPILSDKANMVDVAHAFQPDDIANLPHVQKLSLKNCWFSPHVFTFFFEHMFLEALEEVVLESVSLTGPPALTPQLSVYPGAQYKPSHWPWPLCLGADPAHWFQLSRPNMHNIHQGFLANAVPNAAGAIQAPAAAGLHLPAAVGGALVQQQGHAPGQALNAPAVPINSTTPLALQTLGMHPRRWRAWSWPHILAHLGMAPDAVHRHLEDSNASDKTHEENLKNCERQFAARFKGILEDRTSRGRHQVFHFTSCGYSLIDSPNIDNWQIIPDYPIQVQQSRVFVDQLRDLDSQMLISQDNMLAKIINYIPAVEERQLRDVFNFEFGWDNHYDPIVRQAAIADGSPNPGQARFRGKVGNMPLSPIDRQRLLNSKDETVRLYRF